MPNEGSDFKTEFKTNIDLKKLRTIRMLSSPSQSIEVDENNFTELNKTSLGINENRINFSNKYDDVDSDSNEVNQNRKAYKDDAYQINKLNLFGKSNLKRSKSLDLSSDRETLQTRKNKEYQVQVSGACKGK